jgi:hypothetical protein
VSETEEGLCALSTPVLTYPNFLKTLGSLDCSWPPCRGPLNAGGPEEPQAHSRTAIPETEVHVCLEMKENGPPNPYSVRQVLFVLACGCLTAPGI